jgi:hypothetical protein
MELIVRQIDHILLILELVMIEPKPETLGPMRGSKHLLR